MKRILFVDDEQNVLEGIRRMLHSMRKEWAMHFVTSGAAALAKLDEEPFDVVVSDVRMPGMSGAELLVEVQRRHPRVVRMILSGQSDEERIMKSIGPAHRYLSKPCSPEMLREAIQRAATLSEVISVDYLRDMASTTDTLPSLPRLYQRLMEVLERSDGCVRDVAGIIAADPPMTAKVLQLVNSAYFGLPRKIGSAEQAVSYIGLDMVRALALTTRVFAQFETCWTNQLCLDDVWEHGLSVARLAEAIARCEGRTRAEQELALTAGLLHDVGMLVLAQHLRQGYDEIIRTALDRRVPLVAAELEILGATHAEVGGFLLGLWGLPEPLVEAVTKHHSPCAADAAGFTPLVAVHAADGLLRSARNCACLEEASVPDWSYLAGTGLESHVDRWAAEAEYLRAGKQAA